MEKLVESKLAKLLDVSQAEADRIWNATEQALIESIKEDSELRLRGFGTFVTVDRPAQTIKHPISGESFDVPAYKAVDFRASSKLRQAVNPEVEVTDSDDDA